MLPTRHIQFLRMPTGRIVAVLRDPTAALSQKALKVSPWPRTEEEDFTGPP